MLLSLTWEWSVSGLLKKPPRNEVYEVWNNVHGQHSLPPTPQNNPYAPHVNQTDLPLWGHSPVKPHPCHPSSPALIYTINYMQLVIFGSHILLYAGLAVLPNTIFGDDSASRKWSRCGGRGLISASFVLLTSVVFLHWMHKRWCSASYSNLMH